MIIENNNVIRKILEEYGLLFDTFAIAPVGSGYIHQTYKLDGAEKYILQRVNKNVFRKPEIIAANLKTASEYLSIHHPDHLFLTALPTKTGDQMAYDDDGFPWRIFPYFDNTYTIDKVDNAAQAFSAASEFARLSVNLEGVDLGLFKPTIERFHDLGWRYEQFLESLGEGLPERKETAADIIQKAKGFKYLVDKYEQLVGSGILRLRITHNDTKINNILFDATTDRAVTAIDLDTLMPGYFIYDLGDMIRTFVSPVDEEETDLDKIIVRKEIYDAIIRGYLSQMKDILSPKELAAVPFSGMMMTYIMALRMLADFLNGDVYYQIRYKDQNLIRATNQFRLLEQLQLFTRNQ